MLLPDELTLILKKNLSEKTAMRKTSFSETSGQAEQKSRKLNKDK